MSLSIMFTGADDGDDGPFQLASASGWKLFGEWVESLPDGFKALEVFASNGELKDTAELSRQLRKALVLRRPDNPNVLHTAQGLKRLLGVGDRDEMIRVVS